MECSDCGYIFQPFDTSCLRCEKYGKPVPKEEVPQPVEVIEVVDIISCKQCDNDIELGVRYCKFCGSDQEMLERTPMCQYNVRQSTPSPFSTL